jgi:hypothetical protein
VPVFICCPPLSSNDIQSSHPSDDLLYRCASLLPSWGTWHSHTHTTVTTTTTTGSEDGDNTTPTAVEVVLLCHQKHCSVMWHQQQQLPLVVELWLLCRHSSLISNNYPPTRRMRLIKAWALILSEPFFFSSTA